MTVACHGGANKSQTVRARPIAVNSRRRPTRSIWTLLREWRWEFATWLLGSCALVAIIALLAIFRGRALREWASQIRLATVVAALSQISQSALLVSVSSCIGQLKWDWLRQKRSASDLDIFDEASRGPNGSLLMLAKIQLWSSRVGWRTCDDYAPGVFPLCTAIQHN
ncbi:hypothetical protein FB567DRAFT_599919 [Paraphoma chrysanthemicola]|uniref:Uncharacterized protein n=1 Tax=Paraphoma chrysanthemicola TaxID=798071 RepID=A0A8K0RIB1_9PLEO|nr:hypothetical protein FB567DRAFT_599919 [Paraphoma chrysanthemicola]